MDALQRPLSWYESWMIGTPQTPPATARALLAEELLAAIKNSSYDSQTLQEIVLVIDHECLCRESQDRFPNLRRPDDISNRAIATSVIGDFAEQLSSCLVHHINASSRLIRELQFRALLSVLALLQLDGVHAVHADVHRKWQTKINNRFRELIWLPGQSPRLSTETFPRVQCAHLISLGAAYYSQQFVPAEPVAARILAIGSNVMQLVVMVANIALGFGIMGDLGSTLKDLDSNLSGLVQCSNSSNQDLFKLQGLTRIARALHLYSQICIQSAESREGVANPHREALECSKQIALLTLRHILKILNSTINEGFETSVRPPLDLHEQISALFNRGPVKLDRFQYLYGLLDCASQLGCIVGIEEYPNGFAARMRSIIARSGEASFRLKAMEVLFTNKDSCYRERKMILASSKSSPEMQNQLQTEIDFICGDNKPFLSQPAATSEVWMDPPIEEPVLVRKWSSQVQTVRVSLPRGRLYTRIRFSAAGLSPLCSHAYFLNEDSILVYSLSSHGGSLEDNPILRRDALKTRYKAAALSERFVAVLLENSIQVYQYNGPEAGGLRSDIETNGYQWNPRSLIAIHETSERTWIAIGGSTKVDGILSGSIKIYSVEEHNETASLRELPISFTRPKPNPLALDFLKTLAFRPDGQMLVCATNNNRVLIWRLSNQGAPYEAPFIIKKDLNRDIRGGEISSTSLFNSSRHNPYVFCTTSPSMERVVNGGEWSFISPVGSASVRVPNSLVHDLTRLKKSGPIIAAAVSPQGDIAALVEYRGNDQSRLLIMPVVAEEDGGLSTSDPVVLNEAILATKENERIKMSPTAIRFYQSDAGFSLVAVDVKGRVIKKHFGE